MALKVSGSTKVGRNRVVGAIAILLIVGGISLVSAPGAQATQEKVTTSFTGFAFEKSVLTQAMKTRISQWVNSNKGYALVTCIGYTGYNVKNRTKAFLQKLAINRAKSICDFIHSKNGGIAIQSTRGIPASGKTADARKVTVTLIKVDNSEGGTGTVTIGVCDRALTATMQSRIQYGGFYFSKISVRDISSSCKNKLIDIYFLDGDGDQLGASIGFTISGSSVTVPYSNFSPQNIESGSIKTVAFEIRDK
jgi:hypothetical protein